MVRCLGDPACILSVHGKELSMPMSHQLPQYIAWAPNYDRLPGRVSHYLHQYRDYIRCIDVGANIGDTIAALMKSDRDTFLAIEPNPIFAKYLAMNWQSNPNVIISNSMCSAISRQSKVDINTQGGTAQIYLSNDGRPARSQTLDDMINRVPYNEQIHLVKIDTDGFDFEVIYGAEKLLEEHKPVVLFECDACGNENYVDDCLRALVIFNKYGYNQCLVYDNTGYLMGKYSLSDLCCFRNLLFYQLTSKFRYYDILVMQDDDIAPFYKDELRYFTQTMADASLSDTAIAAVEPLL
ncbi:FkbM family methyltransferase [Mucisphaera sp.]|uniref:FkbM family methyltransferase n=1 Tax=Mucisphaera sp. TaxID=2913024 RepID=UPI003D0B5905